MDVESCYFGEEDRKYSDKGQTLEDQLVEERKMCKRLGDALVHCTKENLKVTQQLMVERHHLNLVVMEIRKLRLEVLDWRTIVDILVAEIKVVAPFSPIIEDKEPISPVWSPIPEDSLSECEEKVEVTPEISIAMPIDDASTVVDHEVEENWLETNDIPSDVEAMSTDDVKSEPVEIKPVPKKDKKKKPVPKKNKKKGKTKNKKGSSKKIKPPEERTTNLEDSFVKSINGYQCKICQKVISARAYLSVHLRRHNRTKFQCELCIKSFRDKPGLRDHVMYIHFEVPRERLTCEICGKTFQTKQNVQRHKNSVHRTERPFLCDLCGKGYKVKSILQDHVKWHQKKEGKTYTCRHCGLVLKDLIEMTQHRKTHPMNYSKQCDICGLELPSRVLLWRHWKTHPEIQRFPCDLCDKVFSTKLSLKSHKQSTWHSANANFSCGVCKKRFTLRSSLSLHMRTHHKKCETCGEEFRLAILLEEHSYLHTGIPPFQCPVCSAQFIDRKVFGKHRLTHEEFRPHICDICGNRFPSLSDMRKHRKLHEKWGEYIPPRGRFPDKLGKSSKKKRQVCWQA